MFENVPLLKNFSCTQFEGDDRKWINFKNILEFLRKNHLPTDSIKEIKSFNLLREFKSYKTGTQDIQNETFINLTTFLRYIFHHSDQLKICNQIVHQIEVILHKQKIHEPIQVHNVEELYRNIAKKKLKFPGIDGVTRKDIEANEYLTLCIFENYKENFTEQEWKQICFFEYHFYKNTPDAEFHEFDRQLDLKWEYLKYLENVCKIAKSLQRTSNSIIKLRNERKSIAQTDEQILLYCNNLHLSSLVENELCLATSEDIENVLAFDCLSSCTHQPGIHLFAEVKSERLFQMTDVINTFRVHIENHHESFLHSVVFLKPNTLTPVAEESTISRFEIRDLYLMNKIDQSILSEKLFSETNDIHVRSENDNEKCTRCFKDTVLKPLHWKSFDVLTEWSFDVPLDVQILLETFINPNTINHTNDKEKLVSAKLKKLYGIYDTLLNVYNRNYCGILQDLNTQKLSMNYQSIGTAFAVASGSGATLSLNAAEKKINVKA